MGSADHVTVAIPARLASARLPGKLLAPIVGKPLLQHVWERAAAATGVDELVVVTDSNEIAAAVGAFGGVAIASDPDCDCGTARIASVLHQLRGALIVNLQGDQPLLDPRHLEALIARWHHQPCAVLTPIYRLEDAEQIAASERVKVVVDARGQALYFSRAPIPHLRDGELGRWPEDVPCWGHVGIYGVRRETLASYPTLPPSPLEHAERLEQLRWLAARVPVQTFEVTAPAPPVDTPAQLEQVRRLVSRR
jgi:3-deoxy-D-manno-octulosonate cytidylyltransferase